MRTLLAQKAPDARVIAGTAERIPLDSSSVDAVFVAEAFHWFDSQVAADEIERVLRPRGWLVICFNVWRTGFRPGLAAEGRALRDEVVAKLPHQEG